MMMKTMKKLTIAIIAVLFANVSYGQWGHPTNPTNYDVLQTWDDLFIYDDVTIKGAAFNLTLSNDNESESGIYFKDSQGAEQHADILYDAQNENLNFYIEGNDAASSSNVLVRLSDNRTMYLDGTLKAKEVFVQSNVWADYVFSKEYQLMSLYEVEKYINKNKHLPGIPSENEVKERGVDVAKMNVLLMEKVEELTLHVIQLRKELDALKSNK